MARSLISGWEVKTEPTLSEHRRIHFWCRASKKPREIKSSALWKTNWNEFRYQLEKLKIPLAESAADINDTSDTMEMNITAALDKVPPKRERRVKENKWWTESLSTKRKILKNLYRKRHLHERVKRKYKELKAEFSKDIRAAKEHSWKDFCSRAKSAQEDLSRLIRIMDNPPQKQMSLLVGGGATLDPQGSLKHLLSTHFPDGVLELDQQVRPMQEEVEEEWDPTGVCQYITVC